MIKLINESNNLSDFRGNSRAGNATRVRIKATGRTGWVESVVDDKWGQGIRVIYDDQPGMWPDFFTVDEVEILEPVKKPKTESFDDDFEQYTYVKSKDVNDADGYLTEYTMYYDEVEDRYVFVFGDSDIYNPNDGYEEFDYECDTKREADEWFNNYEGFDDLDESICKESMKDIITDKLIVLNLSFEEFADFVDSFGERTSTKTICKQIMKKFKFTYEEAKWVLENWFAVDDLDESCNLKEEGKDYMRYMVKLTPYKNMYQFRYIDNYFDKSDYCFCDENGYVETQYSGLTKKFFNKLWDKDMEPNVAYGIFTDVPNGKVLYYKEIPENWFK